MVVPDWGTTRTSVLMHFQSRGDQSRKIGGNMPQIKKEFVKAGLYRQKNLSLSQFVFLQLFYISESTIRGRGMSIVALCIHISPTKFA